jgi:hypothetical protein
MAVGPAVARLPSDNSTADGGFAVADKPKNGQYPPPRMRIFT